jgi:quercetin dioxygenase-like cupin family protein
MKEEAHMQSGAERAADGITTLAAAASWGDARDARAQGELLTTEFSVFGAGEVREDRADARGEEVVAILEGEFDIDAAGEHYRLVAGEAILIPPREPRRFACIGAKGVLYRAGLRAALPATA